MTNNEQRRFTRHAMIAEVKFLSDSPPVMARITDISEGGLFIDTMVPPNVGSTVTVSFYLPDKYPDIPVSAAGRVAWNQTTVGMGIEFVKIDEKSRARLKKFLDDL